MNIQKLTNYLVIGLGVLGAVFLGAILAQGDDTIEMNAMQGDFGFISYKEPLQETHRATLPQMERGKSERDCLARARSSDRRKR